MSESSDLAPADDEQSAAPPSIPSYWFVVVLIAAPLLALSPLFRAEFVGWDDQDTIANNAVMLQPPVKAIPQFWTNWRRPFGAIYIPLTQTVWNLLTLVARRDQPDANGNILNAGPYHAINIALHLISAWMAYRLARRLGAVDWAGAAGALLFAIHPVQVEAVAWVSGLKDVLSGALSIAALLAFVRFVQAGDEEQPRGRWGWYACATLAFVMAMFAKPSAVVVPTLAGLVGMAALAGRRRGISGMLLALVPWLLLAAPFAIVGRYVQPAHYIIRPSLAERPMIALDSLAFYLKQFVAPSRLAVDYGRSPKSVLRSGQLTWTWIVPLAVLAAVVVIARIRRAPLLTIGLLMFFLAPLPVLGLVPFEFQVYSTVADHYTYVAMVGPALIAALLLGWIKPSQVQSAMLATGAVLAILGITTFIQAQMWQDTLTLFDHNLVINPNSFAAHRVMGFQFAKKNDKLEEAEKHYTEALKYWPEDPLTHLNLANLLQREGRTAEAVDHYRMAAKGMENDPQFHNNFGTALAQLDQLDEAYKELHQALVLSPYYAEADANVGRVLAMKGNLRAAIAHFERALKINPDLPRVTENLAQARAMAATLASTRPATSTSAPSTTRSIN